MLCLAVFVVFLVRVPHQPRDPGNRLSRNLATIAARYPRPVVAGAWNAGGYSWAALEHPSVRVVNLDCLVNNVAFEAVRRGTYRRYIVETVDVLLEDPKNASKFLDSLEVDRLASVYRKWDGHEIWVKE